MRKKVLTNDYKSPPSVSFFVLIPNFNCMFESGGAVVMAPSYKLYVVGSNHDR